MKTIKELEEENNINHGYPNVDINCIRLQALKDVVKLINELYSALGYIDPDELIARIEG